jgi:hypothetical protein
VSHERRATYLQASPAAAAGSRDRFCRRRGRGELSLDDASCGGRRSGVGWPHQRELAQCGCRFVESPLGKRRLQSLVDYRRYTLHSFPRLTVVRCLRKDGLVVMERAVGSGFHITALAKSGRGPFEQFFDRSLLDAHRRRTCSNRRSVWSCLDIL